MIIYLKKSRIFTQDPSLRFAQTYGVDPDIWRKLWSRHVLLKYTPNEMGELYHIMTGKRLNDRAMKRWILRTNIYSLTSPVIKRGAEAVTLDFFGDYKDEVLREVLKSSGTRNNKKII